MWVSVSDASRRGKGTKLHSQSTVLTRYIGWLQMLAWDMDKKQINDPKMTVNFLIWVGGVFMLALFALACAFRMEDFIAWRPAKKMAPFLGPSFEEANLVGVSGRLWKLPFRQPEQHFGKVWKRSERGSLLWVAASWLHARKHLPSQKQEMRARSLEFNKSLANHGLAAVPLEEASPII